MNPHDYRLVLGPCTEYDFDLGELVDHTLAPEREVAVRAHLAGCMRCRRFLDDMTHVDAVLAGTLPRPSLSAGFDERLQARIAGLQLPARAVAVAEAEREYTGMLESLRRGLRLITALNAMASASVAGGLVVALHVLVPELAGSLASAQHAPDAIAVSVMALAIAGGLFAGRRVVSGTGLG